MAKLNIGSTGKANLLAILAILALISVMVAMVSSLGYHYLGHRHLDDTLASLKADSRDIGVRLENLERKEKEEKEQEPPKAAEIPTGTITAYWGTGSAPDGWLFCNGMVIDRRKAPQYGPLVDHLNRVAGLAGGDTASLPDLRGLFLRGMNMSGAEGETAATRDPSSDRALGHIQEDKIARHIHRFLMPWQTKMGGSGSGYEDQLRKDPDAWREHFTGDTDEDYSPVFGSETRPINIAVNFIIKI